MLYNQQTQPPALASTMLATTNSQTQKPPKRHGPPFKRVMDPTNQRGLHNDKSKGSIHL